jgi:CcmD family protein
MRPILTVLLALSLLATAPLHAQAPAGETATEAAAASSAGAPTSIAAPAVDAPQPASDALPRYTPPRTLRAYAHVFVAFAVAWVLLFGYVVFLSRKFRRVEEQVDALARS